MKDKIDNNESEINLNLPSEKFNEFLNERRKRLNKQIIDKLRLRYNSNVYKQIVRNFINN